jgi:hypothetical protein
MLVRTGYAGKENGASPAELPKAVVVDDLAAAADWILKNRFFTE